MKKKNVFFIILFLLLLLAVGTTGIYASGQGTVSNVNTGVVNIEIDEFTLDENGKETPWVDGVLVAPGSVISKIPYFTATGNDCYIRATITIDGLHKDAKPITHEDFNGISEDWVKIGDYFYYKKPLKTKESIDFFHSFTVPQEWGNNINPSNADDWDFSIDVTVDAIQADNFQPDFDGEKPWGDVEIKDSIHKDGYDVNIFTGSSETNMTIIIEDLDKIVVSSENFFEGFKTMMPGDELSDDIEINSKENCKVYFSSTALKDVEFLEKLDFKVVVTQKGKDNVVYQGKLGDSLDKILLGEFKKGEKATVTFTVSMPSDLDNEYTLRDGSVKWTFKSTATKNNGEAQTGDDMQVMLILGLLIVSGVTTIGVVVAKKKKEQKTNDEKQS